MCLIFVKKKKLRNKNDFINLCYLKKNKGVGSASANKRKYPYDDNNILLR